MTQLEHPKISPAPPLQGRPMQPNPTLQPHDLLQLRPDPALLVFDTPDAAHALQALAQTPWAVVRRGPTNDGRIPIGIRGATRNQRYAAWVHPSAILHILPPPALLARSTPRDLPVFAALAQLQLLWAPLSLPWGPTGSAAFELATGQPAAHPASDLDLVLQAPRRLTRDEIQLLADSLDSLSIATDLQIQTPHGTFLFADWRRSPHSILLRTDEGGCLTSDPWASPCQ